MTMNSSHFPMPSVDLTGKLIIKAQLGNDIRKIPIHNEEITYEELLIMMQRLFHGKIKSSDEITIKVKDEDGDLVTIYDSSDLLFAKSLSRYLKLVLFVNGKPEPLQHNQIKEIKGELLTMRDQINNLIGRLDEFVGPITNDTNGPAREENSTGNEQPASTPEPPSQPAKVSVNTAMFDPLQNGTASAAFSKPSQYDAPKVDSPAFNTPTPSNQQQQQYPSSYTTNQQQQYPSSYTTNQPEQYSANQNYNPAASSTSTPPSSVPFTPAAAAPQQTPYAPIASTPYTPSQQQPYSQPAASSYNTQPQASSYKQVPTPNDFFNNPPPQQLYTPPATADNYANQQQQQYPASSSYAVQGQQTTSYPQQQTETYLPQQQQQQQGGNPYRTPSAVAGGRYPQSMQTYDYTQQQPTQPAINSGPASLPYATTPGY